MDVPLTHRISSVTSHNIEEEHMKLASKIKELLIACETDGINNESTQQILIETLSILEGMIAREIPISEEHIDSILPIIHSLINNTDLLGQLSYPKIASCLLSKGACADEHEENGQHELLQCVQSACWLCPNISNAIPWETHRDLCTSLANRILNLPIIDFPLAGKLATQLLESPPQTSMQNPEVLLKARAYYYCNSPKEAISMLTECLSHQPIKTGWTYIDDTVLQMQFLLADAYVADEQPDKGKEVYYRLVASCGNDAYHHLLLFLPSTGGDWLAEATKIHLIMTSTKDKSNTVDNIVFLLDLAKFYSKNDQIHVTTDILEHIVAKACVKCSEPEITAIAKCASNQFTLPFCMQLAVILLKENSKNSALIFLKEFSDKTSEEVQYLLARAHLEMGNFAECSKIAQSLEDSADKLGLVCCSHILNSQFNEAIQDFNSAHLVDSNPSANHFTPNIYDFMQTLIGVLDKVCDTRKHMEHSTEHPLYLLNQLLPFLASIPLNYLEVKSIIRVLGLIFFRLDPVISFHTATLVRNFDANPSAIFDKVLEFIAFALFSPNQLPQEEGDLLCQNFFSLHINPDSMYNSHRNYLGGGCFFLDESFSEANEALAFALESDTSVGMYNHLANKYQREVAGVLLKLSSLLQEEGNVGNAQFQACMQTIVQLMINGKNLGPWERLLLANSIDILIAKGKIEINTEWWNSAKLAFIRNPDPTNLQEIFVNFSKFLN